jgi:hypothetical protein
MIEFGMGSGGWHQPLDGNKIEKKDQTWDSNQFSVRLHYDAEVCPFGTV